MEKVTMYRCEYCGNLFDTAELSAKHEQRHRNIDGANEMLREGATLEQINQRYKIWSNVPDHLKEATKDNCFRISYWQCCNKPAYTMREIKMDGRIRLFGCGSWNGYYGSDVRIDSTDLKDIHQLSDGTLWEGQIALYFRWTCLPDGAVPELAAGSRRDDR